MAITAPALSLIESPDREWLPAADKRRNQLFRLIQVEEVRPGRIWDVPDPHPHYPEYEVVGGFVQHIVVDGCRAQALIIVPLVVSAADLIKELDKLAAKPVAKLRAVSRPWPKPKPTSSPPASAPSPPQPPKPKPVPEKLKPKPCKKRPKQPLQEALALLRRTAGTPKRGWAANWRARQVIAERFGCRAAWIWHTLYVQHKVIRTGYRSGQEELIMVSSK